MKEFRLEVEKRVGIGKGPWQRSGRRGVDGGDRALHLQVVVLEMPWGAPADAGRATPSGSRRGRVCLTTRLCKPVEPGRELLPGAAAGEFSQGPTAAKPV